MAQITIFDRDPRAGHHMPIDRYAIGKLELAIRDAKQLTEAEPFLYAVVQDDTGHRTYYHKGKQYT